METAIAGSFSERRSAPRFSLVMRTAKLISQSGEYVCIVRDVSETGVKLRLFHPAPPDQFLFLALANGRIHPLQFVWQEENHAGYRFTATIDVEEFIDEPSSFGQREVHLSLDRQVTLEASGRSLTGRLVNISQQGACVELRESVPIRKAVTFVMDGAAKRTGHICWRRGPAHGLVFQDTMSLNQFAEAMMDLQPFEPVHSTNADCEIRCA